MFFIFSNFTGLICNFITNHLPSIFFLALHVVNPNAFPKSLSLKEEKKLVKLMELGDANAKLKLIEHNLRLVAHIVKKFHHPQEESEDLISVGSIGLIKGINTYNTGKASKLSSYISRCIENEILMHFRSAKKTSLDISINEPVEISKDGDALTLLDTLQDETVILDEVSSKLSAEQLGRFVNQNLGYREKTIINLRYGLKNRNPLTQQEVADKLQISRSYVSRLEKKTLYSLQKMLK
ncbi:MAG: RNA polymerase sporulation sigma factor SigK [Candidatus Improbicoccus devescovinae]|nr:MAG: RNA polymerase sporulation sigma factor SigK [Candidatus Improbicoccus devescovinae]